MNEVEYIVAIRYLKQTGEFVVTQRNNTGKQSVTYANHLTRKERTWVKESERCFDDAMSICWVN